MTWVADAWCQIPVWRWPNPPWDNQDSAPNLQTPPAAQHEPWTFQVPDTRLKLFPPSGAAGFPPPFTFTRHSTQRSLDAHQSCSPGEEATEGRRRFKSYRSSWVTVSLCPCLGFFSSFMKHYTDPSLWKPRLRLSTTLKISSFNSYKSWKC